jgi:hypothetical protein
VPTERARPNTRSERDSIRGLGRFEFADKAIETSTRYQPKLQKASYAPFGELYALTHTIQRIDAHAPRGSREPVRCDSCLESGPPKVTRARQGSDLWKATRERPDSPDLILHIEVGVPPLGGGGSTCDQA